MKSKKIVYMLACFLSSLVFLAACVQHDSEEHAFNNSIEPENRVESNWPIRPVTIVVPFPAGGDTDFYARTYASFLQDLLHQPFEVVNVPGDAGTHGASQVSHATPDGYTVLFYHTGNLFANVISGDTTLNYRDFAISNISNFDESLTLIAGAHMGITNASDFLRQARANPGYFRVATTIPGFTFFALRSMEHAGNFSVSPVNVSGAGVMAQAIIDGEADFAVGPHALFRSGIANGDLVPLMVGAKRRNPNFRYVTTVEDMGLTDASMGSAYFFAFPLGTDEAILHGLSDAVAQIQFNDEYVTLIKDAFYARPFFLPTAAVRGFFQEIESEMYQIADYLEHL